MKKYYLILVFVCVVFSGCTSIPPEDILYVRMETAIRKFINKNRKSSGYQIAAFAYKEESLKGGIKKLKNGRVFIGKWEISPLPKNGYYAALIEKRFSYNINSFEIHALQLELKQTKDGSFNVTSICPFKEYGQLKKKTKSKSTTRQTTPVDNCRLDFITTERGEPIQLKNGKYECRKLGNFNIVDIGSVCYCGENTDILSSYGAIITVNSGGSGYFVYLVLIRKGISVAHKFLGDRIRVKDIYFRDGQLQAEYFVRTKGQDMSEVPTQLKVAKIECKKENPLALRYDSWKNYAKIASEDNALSTKDYPRILKEFHWWMQKFLKPEYVPSQNFVQQNILLIPADKVPRKMDLAFLSYEFEGKIFMIVQSGGIRGRVLIFVNTYQNPNNTKDALTMAQSFINEYIKKGERKYIPSFVAQRYKDGFWAKVQLLKGRKSVNNAWCFIGKSEICFSLQKRDFEGTLEARVPMPDEWFSWNIKKNKSWWSWLGL